MKTRLNNRATDLYRLLAGFVLAAILVTNTGPVLADPLSLTLSGKVFYQGGTTPVTDATVLALQNMAVALKVSANTDRTGSYSLSLPAAGDWQVVVLPHESDPTQSPDWVYTAGA
jgi:hypothetical protein